MRQHGAVRVTSDPRADVVALVGGFDGDDDQRIREAVAGGRPLIVDLGACTAIGDSLVVLLREAQGTRLPCSLVLVLHQDSPPWRVLGEHGALPAFRIVTSVEAALGLFAKASPPPDAT